MYTETHACREIVVHTDAAEWEGSISQGERKERNKGTEHEKDGDRDTERGRGKKNRAGVRIRAVSWREWVSAVESGLTHDGGGGDPPPSCPLQLYLGA